LTRIVSIDYGLKRCGIAHTDLLQIAVHPVKVVATNQLFEFLLNYIPTESVTKIVFGKATHADGTPTIIWDSILDIQRKLKEKFPTLEFDHQDEAFTSSQAVDIMIQSGMKKSKRRNKENIDLISAILILQRYLKHI